MNMYTALIVDDEIFAVKGILSGVNWQQLGIHDVYEAYHATMAKERLQTTPVDVIICDIEMPDETGLELVEWIKIHYPEIIVIFLTCHADFSFAQKAIQLGSYDYLLKPVIFSDLEQILHGALDSINERREQKETADQLKKYQLMWEQKKTALIERFWQDILCQRLLLSHQTLEAAIEELQIPLATHTDIRLILISVEQWEKLFTARDEEIMSFALRNAAEEILIGTRSGHVVEDHKGNMIVLLYNVVMDPDQEQEQELLDACSRYMKACREYLYCVLSCYVGESVPLVDMMKSYHLLLEWEHKNVIQTNQVLLYREYGSSHHHGLQSFSLIEWADWFEKGDREKLHELVERQMMEFHEQKVTIETLEAYYHSFLQVVYYVLHRKGLQVQMLYKDGAMAELSLVTRSLSHLEQWMKQMIGSVMNLLFSKRPPNSIVQKMKDYIAANLEVDFSREDLAEHVFLNPAYISRLFRAETDMSLSDYILQERMKQASELLLSTDQPVSQIAVNLGYGNFSYFARMFKRVYGVTPQEYRKK
ncbi:helix-turn-helix domain-containing protein [Paenibacillus hexagrammi]|uniref:Helix-turn-helix domain-containing protein n=1 Tax=Paenibacillus hexagrammi TaxID=2908839 RepID=A0ABY3SN95_9BACL|nr:helix-turn-helix domain-containing protein [Paenibacillus sp. YPD9-1]UJF34963.1 helix-turn-helix domain-containing protein [Paenibacillus sp. YPD9-1]